MNGLFDPDLDLLGKDAAALDALTGCALNLSYNRFENADESLKAVLRVCTWVDVTMCPLASFNRKDLFESFSRDAELRPLFMKLIWIEQDWLPPKQWARLLDNEELEDDVMNTHVKYYKDVVWSRDGGW